MYASNYKVQSGRYKGRTVYVHSFDGPADFAARLADYPFQNDSFSGDSWFDSSEQNYDAYVADVKAGGVVRHSAAIAEAQKGIKVPAFRLYGSTLGMSVGAGVPIIPAVLAGQPEHSLTLTEAADVTTPVRFFLPRMASAGVDVATLAKVGAILAATIEIVRASRPVEIWAVCNVAADGSTNACSIRVPLTPHCSTAELGLYCVGTAVFRRTMFSIARQAYKSGVGIPWAFGAYDDADAAMRAGLEDMNLTPSDIVVPGVRLDDPLVKNPTGWAEDTLTKVFGKIE